MEKSNRPLNFLVKILLGGIAVLIAAFLLPGIHIDTVMTGFILAAVIILINVTLKPILVILTLPITFLTLGLFLLVINALMIMLADRIIPGFQVDGFWWAVLFAVVVSMINSLFGNDLNPSD
ncbi:phage holin family protein [Algoriphagus sp. Y33]|uniref:phage holin family protein n=1 Tax=Algoriphagus sp. Y33 TaxID=2772483 RepID=UPI0017837046|nr:phage holin family protein [Algoriphagus sp. Y33]